MRSALSLLQIVSAAAAPVHIIHVLMDDFGWADVGFHNNNSALYPEIQTPNLDKLVQSGIELDNHYAFKFCSPSRCALQTGRNPVHVNVQNVPPENVNPDDPVGGYQGIPINMTGIAEKLKHAGYSTHLVGKWDAGMATDLHSPTARGYDSWLGYWHHANDYWSFGEGTCESTTETNELVRDLWRYDSNASTTDLEDSSDIGRPAMDLQNADFCSQLHQSDSNTTCVYEEKILLDRVVDIILNHDVNDPLFLLWSSHLVHMPLQAPSDYVDKFKDVDDEQRRMMRAMTNYLDDAIGQMVTALQHKDMWNNTLIVGHADNGGEIMFEGICGGNNWPLRGGKFSNWQGGIKTVAFVSGGMVPPARRGTTLSGHVTAWDWYATYCDIAGVDVDDAKSSAAGLPDVDGIAQWPYLSGANLTSPRNQVLIGDTSATSFNGDGKTLVGGIIRGEMKLLIGASNKDYRVDQDVITGPLWPNKTSEFHPINPLLTTRRCTRDPKQSCLFNLTADPTETTSVAEQQPDLFAELLDAIDQAQKTVYSPDRGSKDPKACKAAQNRSFYWGPWL